MQARKGDEGARSQKKSISSAREILSPLEEEIFFVFQRNRFLAEKKSEESKGRSEAKAGHNLFCKSQFSVTDLIKLSSSMQKNVGLGNHPFALLD